MSDLPNQDKVVRDLTSAIENLSIAAQTLSRHVVGETSSSSSAVPASPVVSVGDWEVVEEESFPNPLVAKDIAESFSFRGVEEGPLDIPPACLELARRRLISVSIGAEGRARRAFKAGFWSKAAIDTCTKYSPEQPLSDLKLCHWVVLRSGNNTPFRVTTQAAFREITHKDYDIVAEAFASQAEVQIYCLGAGAPVPPLVKCRK